MYIYIHIYIHIYTHIHTQWDITWLLKKDWNNAICNNMDGPKDYYIYTKWNKPDREWQISYDIAYMWNVKKKDTNELIFQNRNRLTDIETNLWLWKGRGEREDKLGVWY